MSGAQLSSAESAVPKGRRRNGPPPIIRLAALLPFLAAEFLSAVNIIPGAVNIIPTSSQYHFYAFPMKIYLSFCIYI